MFLNGLNPLFVDTSFVSFALTRPNIALMFNGRNRNTRYSEPRKAHRVERTTPGHAGPVYAVAKVGAKGYVTAGKDGFVRLWDGELQKLKQVENGVHTLHTVHDL